MSKYSRVTVFVPDIDMSAPKYSDASVKRQNIAMLQRINNTYGKTVEYWGKVFEIPRGVLISFIATESGGINVGANRFKATGLMQVTPNSIWESVKKWKSTVGSDLPVEAESVLKRKASFVLTSKSIRPTTAESNTLINLLYTDTNFNIMTGTMLLRWLLQRFSSPISGFNVGQLNKAIVAYNAGAYLTALGGAKGSTTPIDTTALYQLRIPTESKGYILKMLGRDGFLQLVYKEKAI